MIEEPEVHVYRGNAGTAEDKARYPTPTAVVTHRGCKLVFRFAGKDDVTGEGALMRVELLPDEEQLEPAVVRQFIPQAGLYLAYARAAMRILGADEPTPAERWETFSRSTQPLRELGGPGRKLPDGFYRRIADNYRDLRGEGEPHPIKAIAQIHHVSIGAASRWVSGARDRGYLPAKGTE